MVRAILREIEAPGTGKTQTRRLAWSKREPSMSNRSTRASRSVGATEWLKLYRRWAAGERDVRLWVREAWAHVNAVGGPAKPGDSPQTTLYRATCHGAGIYRWRPSIHMPRWASRITLEVTDVRLQRLQEIVADDAIAEGIERDSSAFMHAGWLVYDSPVCPTDGRPGFVTTDPVYSFASLWRSIHGPGAWEENPEVVAVSFRPHLRNIDEWGAAL
ncbi:MAG TPA: hypothetical protein VF188_16275 [Longimicrobiales bacterium]